MVACHPVATRRVRSCHNIGRVNRTYHLIRIAFRCLRNDNVQVFPDIVFQLAHVDSLSTLRIVDELGANAARRPLSTAEEFLLIISIYGPIAAVINIVKGRPIIIVILEELSVEWDGSSVAG